MELNIARVLLFAIGGVGSTWQFLRWIVDRDVQREYVAEPLGGLRRVLSYVSGLPVVIWFFWPETVDFATLPAPEWVTWLGNGLLGVCLVLWMLSQIALGTNWSALVAVKKDHQLITTGPYAYVRHPMYTAYILLAVGVLLVTTNVLVTFLFAVYIWLTVRRAKQEDVLMETQFDDEYRGWAKRTGAFFPGL